MQNKILVNDMHDLVPELFIACPNFEQSDQAVIDVLPIGCRESFFPSTNFTIFIEPEPNMHCEREFFSQQLAARPNSIFAVSGYSVERDWVVPYILNFANLTMTVRVNAGVPPVESGAKKYLANALLGGWSMRRSRILSQLIKENLDKQCLVNYHARSMTSENKRQHFGNKFPEYGLSYRTPELNNMDNPTFVDVAFDSGLVSNNALANTCRPIPGTKQYQHKWVSQLVPYEIYNSSYISIVAETEADLDSFFVSEKISKPLLLAQPFVVFGGHHYLKNLRKLGFKTFHPWIDESYDNITNKDQRVDAIVKSVKQFSMLSDAEKSITIDQLKSILEHNRALVLDYCWTTKTIADSIVNFSTNSNIV